MPKLYKAALVCCALIASTAHAAPAIPSTLKELSNNKLATVCWYELFQIGNAFAEKSKLTEADKHTSLAYFLISAKWLDVTDETPTTEAIADAVSYVRDQPAKVMGDQIAWCQKIGRALYEDSTESTKSILATEAINSFNRARLGFLKK